MNVASSQFNLSRPPVPPAPLSPNALAYQESVAKACGVALDKRILAFSAAAPSPDREDLRTTWNRPLRSMNPTKRRKIPTTPERVLDAPGLLDDYYLNLLSWSKRNIVAIALSGTVYLWDWTTSNVTSFAQFPEDVSVTSVGFSNDGHHVALGLSTGNVQIHDTETTQRVRTMAGHAARVGVLAWNKGLLATGCRDGSIWNCDVKIKDFKVGTLEGHTSEVCGLAWGSGGLASGGNDNLVNVWDIRLTNGRGMGQTPKLTMGAHSAAVKVKIE